MPASTTIKRNKTISSRFSAIKTTVNKTRMSLMIPRDKLAPKNGNIRNYLDTKPIGSGDQDGHCVSRENGGSEADNFQQRLV
jgi:hypothetical protein